MAKDLLGQRPEFTLDILTGLLVPRGRTERPQPFVLGQPYRIPVGELQVESAGADALVLSFALPKGSYALAVLREVLKSGGEPDFH